MTGFLRGTLPICLVLALAKAAPADDPRPMRATPEMLRRAPHVPGTRIPGR